MYYLRVNVTSPRQIPMHILMSMANKLPCILVIYVLFLIRLSSSKWQNLPPASQKITRHLELPKPALSSTQRCPAGFQSIWLYHSYLSPFKYPSPQVLTDLLTNCKDILVDAERNIILAIVYQPLQPPFCFRLPWYLLETVLLLRLEEFCLRQSDSNVPLA